MKHAINTRISLALGLGLTLAALCLSLNPGSALSKAPAAELHVCPVGCPYSSVQAAVDAANEGDIIKVASGNYSDINTHSGSTQIVYISKSITIKGGYTLAFSDPPEPNANPTTLNAQGLGRVLRIAENVSPTVEGLHITGGRSDYGSGIYVFNATATISNCQIFSNTALYSGGGIGSSYSTLILNRSLISRNSAQETGGGMDLSNSIPKLSNNIIQGNTAYLGGGIYVWQGSNTLFINNFIASNQATSAGSGLYLAASSLQLLHTTIAHNQGNAGSGIHLTAGSTLALTNTILVTQTVGITSTAGSIITINGILWFGNGANIGGSGAINVTRAITGDPAFASDDYHLTADSAAIDKGIDTSTVTDIDGDTRPDGCFPDLGADEFAAGQTCQRLYLPLVLRQSP